jgi:F-type H+-transporting ATPase subunit a
LSQAMAITMPVLWIFMSTLLIVLILYAASRKPAQVPKSYLQNIFELAIEFTEKQIMLPSGLEDKKWQPFLLGIFLFILFNDWIGIIPGATPATSNINLTAALALLIFTVGTFLRFKGLGLRGAAKSLIPEGVKGPLALLLFPIELISQLVKPFSLAIRLFANMSAGHLILLSILGFTVLFGNFLVSIISVAGSAVIITFEIFIGFMQAYVFTFLSALFFSEAVAETH